MNNIENFYEPPRVAVLEVRTELGFADSAGKWDSSDIADTEENWNRYGL